MANAQEIFNRIKEKQHEQRELKTIYRDLQAGSKPYQEIMEKLKALKDEKKKLEEGFQDEMKSELAKLDGLKSDIASDREMLSDIALTQIMKGEKIEITDEYNNKYEPLFTVKFKKI